MKLNEYSRTILFDSGKHLQKETYPTLLSITEILKEYPYSRFLVEGHTDSDGSNEMNQTLSENRAAAVKIIN
jgi:outer membrane protein OmpA-like peptidoglycan-associated protein